MVDERRSFQLASASSYLSPSSSSSSNTDDNDASDGGETMTQIKSKSHSGGYLFIRMEGLWNGYCERQIKNHEKMRSGMFENILNMDPPALDSTRQQTWSKN